MSDRAVRLYRVMRCTPDKLYRAFLEAEALTKWLPPYGHTGQMEHMQAEVGGTFRMSFRQFGTGHVHAFGGEYLELLAHQRIRYTDRFDAPGLSGTIEVAVNLRPVMGGTELEIVQSGIPEAIPLEMCHLGWQESLAQLAHLVEPEIKG